MSTWNRRFGKWGPGASAALVALACGAPVACGQGEWVYRDALGNRVERGSNHSTARMWNEALLYAIERDFARPTIHARNLFHTSVAMYDVWAAYDTIADQFKHHERATAADVGAARSEAISYAMYRVLRHRFATSPGGNASRAYFDNLMNTLGYDIDFTSTEGDTPAALGNRVAATIIAWGLTDGSNEGAGYANQYYAPINPPLVVALEGNPDLVDMNRWQPLALDFFVDQGGNVIIGGFPPFLSPEWGNVDAFALHESDMVLAQRDGHDWPLFHDPGTPPQYGGANDHVYRWGFEMVSTWSSHLDPNDGVMWDVSPGRIGDAIYPTDLLDFTLYPSWYDMYTGEEGSVNGHALNPATGLPYEPQIVPRGDYTRVLAEFWADGPQSHTPPGHWYDIFNYVVDHPQHERRFGGTGPIMDALEYDVKSYMALGGTVHDVAVSAWGLKGYYDYIRPVSAIRALADRGQCSDPNQASFHPDGITLHPGFVEVITSETTAFGEKHEHLFGEEGKIAILAWRGPPYLSDPTTDAAGVGWILAGNWWSYQRATFVTPPFAGYVSGHSTFSRASAETMTLITGNEFFPGGMGEFHYEANGSLIHEFGPSVDVTLQWAKYRDASDQCSLSRIWGGIHPAIDDLPGRWMGSRIGPRAFNYANMLFNGRVSCPADFAAPYRRLDFFDLQSFLRAFSQQSAEADIAAPFGVHDIADVQAFLTAYSKGCP